jgi:hypothetical protein
MLGNRSATAEVAVLRTLVLLHLSWQVLVIPLLLTLVTSGTKPPRVSIIQPFL